MLTHDLAGEGPSVVLLLHSGVCDRRMWDAQFTALVAAGHRVVRCDLRGFGETPIDRPHTHCDDVVELLDTLGVERAALVGSSFGGEVALETAVRHPDRVSALVLLCAGMPGFEASDELRAWGRREDELLEAGDLDGAVALNVDTWLGPEAGDEARERVRVMQRRAFDVQLAAPEEFHPVDAGVKADDLAGIDVPCLIVSGGHDVPDFRAISRRLADLLPDSQHIDLDWAGHLPALERPDEVSGLLVEYLTVEGGEGAATASGVSVP